MENVKFYKEEDNRWYINMPDFPGEKEELEMVLGADILLDILSNNGDFLNTNISVENQENSIELTKTRFASDIGSGYYYKTELMKDEFWLCDVTKFVFGDFPNKIYLKIIR